MDISRARRAEVIDEHAAIFILQGALDRLATLRGERRTLRMAIVIAALMPVFLLIVLGIVLKRTLMRLETQWHGLERLTYYVLFPMLLIQTLVKADLTKVPVAGVGGALLISALAMSLLCLALRPLLARCAIDGPAFTSIFQGATRWQTYVALAVSGNLYGDVGLALASVAMVAIIPLVNVFSVAVLAHYASPEKRSVGSIAMTVVRNPLIWACAIGLVLNVTHIPLPKIWHQVADALGSSSLAIGLLVTGAGLHLEGLFRPNLAASVAVALKLILMPVLAVGLALWFGLSGANLAIVAACSAVPASSSAYVLARQMGGDAPLLAQIITLQTISRRSPCRSRSPGGVTVMSSHQPHGLYHRGQIVEAVQHVVSQSDSCGSAYSRAAGRSKIPRQRRTRLYCMCSAVQASDDSRIAPGTPKKISDQPR